MADTPITREEKYLAYLTGDYKADIPKPITRQERYLYELCLKGMGGEISPEEIQKAVNDYLDKNPVKPGATTEQAQQIKQNTDDVASLKEDLDNLLADVSYFVFNDVFTITKNGADYNCNWDTSNFACGAMLFDTNKIKIRSNHNEVVIAHNESYGRIVTFNVLTGKVIWNKNDSFSTSAEITTLSGGIDARNGITITKESDRKVIISDGTTYITVDADTISDWNNSLYPTLDIGVFLNTYYVNGYPVVTLLDDFNENRKEVSKMINEINNDNDILYGKKLIVLGDSYIRGNTLNISDTWSYKLAQKHCMQYVNYGVNGNGMVANTGTTPMVERYTEMDNDADIIIVQGGKDDFNTQISIDEFKSGLNTLCLGLINKYIGKTIIFGTPWRFDDNTYPVSDYPLTIQQYSDAIIEVCGKYSIPVFDCSRFSGVHLWSIPFRQRYMQNTDVSHLNADGMDYIMPKWENIIKLYATN